MVYQELTPDGLAEWADRESGGVGARQRHRRRRGRVLAGWQADEGFDVAGVERSEAAGRGAGLLLLALLLPRRVAALWRRARHAAVPLGVHRGF